MTEEQFVSLLPSQLVELAINDTKALEESAFYEFDMSTWHYPKEVQPGNPHCLICIAGAVMANSLGVQKGDNTQPLNFPEGVKGRLYAIDQFRRGELNTALNYMDVEKGVFFDEVEVPEFVQGNDNAPFYQAMQGISDSLKAVGL